MADIIKLAEAVASEISAPGEAEVMYAPELDLKGIKELRIIVTPAGLDIKPISRGCCEDVLKRLGAYVRTVARRKVHTSPKPSTAGTPPHSRTGSLKRGILFGVEKRQQSVIIGPSEKFVGTSMVAHEFGGGYKRERYPKRPLMGPSLQESAPHLAKMWRDAVK